MAIEPTEADPPAIVKYVRPVDGEFPPVPVKKGKSSSNCKHPTAVVDDKARRVECESCGAELDPIKLLMDIAEYGDRLESRLEVIRKHEEKQREAAENNERLNKEAAAKKIVTLRQGDEIWIDTRSSGQRGYFGGFQGEPQMLLLLWPGRESPIDTIPIADITGCHIYKRAKAQA